MTSEMLFRIGMDSWIIQDGNYPDFTTGQEAEFAVEFWTEGLNAVETETPAPSAAWVRDSRYDVNASVVLVAEQTFVLDLGIRVYGRQITPLYATVGDWLQGQLELGIDPFDYFERFAVDDDFPPLIYTWRILQIEQQISPFTEISPQRFVRDPSRFGWRTITKTDAWTDDGGRAEYLLTCQCLPVEPKRTSTTACG